MPNEIDAVMEHIIALAIPFIITGIFVYVMTTTTEPLHLIIYGIIAGVSLIVGIARIFYK